MAECKYQKEVDEIIVDNNAKTLVQTAHKIAGEMIQKNRWGGVSEGSSVSTSQIRNLYGTSKKIEMTLDEENVQEMYNRLILLKPKMAYANGRFNKDFGNGKYKIPGFKTLVDSLSERYFTPRSLQTRDLAYDPRAVTANSVSRRRWLLRPQACHERTCAAIWPRR